ncbi:MAG: cysteine desulfurase-like protein [Calditrichaeota bacterium]|nr:cysteine desulfurase-like protein [Calditrichota bacterium]
MYFNVDELRAKFPALSIEDDGKPRVYLDNPAGTQVPHRVLERMERYLVRSNANSGGYFVTARESDVLKTQARQAMADLLNAPDLSEIVFGPNMTTLTYSVSRAIGRLLKPGDSIVVTRMDHDANVYPWLQLAEDLGLTVKFLPFNRETYQFDLQNFAELLDETVKIVAIGHASNALGTINNIPEMCKMAHEYGAWVYVDAVQSAPHIPVDVQSLGCDFLVCSSYKFFGPHQGILWGRKSILDHLKSYQVRPAKDKLPGKFENGTQSHEGMAGVLGALEYLGEVGEMFGDPFSANFPNFSGQQLGLHTAMAAIQSYEQTLSNYLIRGLQQISGVKVHGVTDRNELQHRVPTVTFTKENVHPNDIAKQLAAENTFVWSGHFYAVEVIDFLGLAESGGLLRVGAAHYNTADEIDKLLNVVDSIR